MKSTLTISENIFYRKNILNSILPKNRKIPNSRKILSYRLKKRLIWNKKN